MLPAHNISKLLFNNVLNNESKYIQSQSFKFNFLALIILILFFCLDFLFFVASAEMFMGLMKRKIDSGISLLSHIYLLVWFNIDLYI